MQFIRSEWPGVIRARGVFWLATRMDWVGEISQAGASRRHRAAGSWRSSDASSFGERCQHLAFIGIDMDGARLRMLLDDCLLDDRELARGPGVWQTYADPFPSWPIESIVRLATH